MSLASFALQLDRAYEQKVEGSVKEATKKLALEALLRVIEKSPVLTGRFRGNWQLALTVRPDGVLEVEDKMGGDAQARGVRAISALQPYDRVFIVNNLPYANELENGSSAQAPQGMVAVTVAELQGFLDRVA